MIMMLPLIVLAAGALLAGYLLELSVRKSSPSSSVKVPRSSARFK